MASKKKTALPSAQMGLGLAPPSTHFPALPLTPPNNQTYGATVDGGVRPSLPALPDPSDQASSRFTLGGVKPAAPVDLDSFDDYDDAAHHEDVPRLRLLDPPRDAPTVIVEAVGERFEVSRLRNNGTTVASVMWTRSELKELIMRATSALEMSDEEADGGSGAP